MGGFRVRAGERAQIQQLYAQGVNRAEIARRMNRSTGFVLAQINAPAETVSAVAPTTTSLTAERKALAEMILGMSMDKTSKLKVLEAIL